jgi:hypothetical protein
VVSAPRDGPPRRSAPEHHDRREPQRCRRDRERRFFRTVARARDADLDDRWPGAGAGGIRVSTDARGSAGGRGGEGARCGTGGTRIVMKAGDAWAAAFMLQRRLPARTRVLRLGCGLGLTSGPMATINRSTKEAALERPAFLGAASSIRASQSEVAVPVRRANRKSTSLTGTATMQARDRSHSPHLANCSLNAVA